MSPRTILITGANRGIGFGLTKTFLEVEDVEIVLAGCRNPEKAEELHKITNPKLHVIQLEVSDDASIQKAVGEVGKIVGDKGLNILINNAGVHIPYKTTQEKPSRADLTPQFDVNVCSVILVSQFFLPLIRRAAADKKIINISSGQGSIGDNTTGSGHLQNMAYKATKIEECMADLVPSILKVTKEHNGGYFDKKMQKVNY